jgi:hypothetical protein
MRDGEVVKTIAFVLLAACSPTAMSTPAEHPANPDAPIGRLAGPPAALRPGVADASTPGGQPSVDHSGHGAAPADKPTVDHSGHGAAPADKPAVDHSGHGTGTATPEPTTKPTSSTSPDEPATKAATPAPKKPARKPATPQPKQEPAKPAPAKPAEKPAEKPKQPDPHEGHHGHL